MSRRPTDPPTDRLPLDAIRVGQRHRQHMGDIEALAASIAENGLLHPIVITPERTLIAGERRLLAARQLGWSDVPVTVVPIRDIVRGEVAENVVRQDFTPTEMAAIAAALRPVEEAAARERETHAGDTYGKLPQVSKGATRDRVAAYLGISGRTLEKIEEVVKAADEDPEFGDLVADMDRTGKVDSALHALRKRRVVATIEAEPVPLPEGPWRVIVADPPWRYASSYDAQGRRGATPYPDMSIEEIEALGPSVQAIAHEDAILWLWTTNAHMEYAFPIARAWGFEPRTILTWAKDRMGVGDWLRGQTEHCLMAVRGHPVVTLTNQTTLLWGPLREHSRKPDEFYALVEALCPGSKLEMFAREARAGWQLWGAEAPAA